MFSFEKKSNPLVSLGVGKKALIIKWLDEMGVENYIINDDLTIDVKGNVSLVFKKLIKFPNYIQFYHIQGYFSCSNNELISLNGSPLICDDGFFCNFNKLDDLNYLPKIINGNLYCYANNIDFTKEYCNKISKISGKIDNI